MSANVPIKGAVLGEAILNVIGSLSSFLGASLILICYALLPQRRHFRHALIINLALSDAINGLNNATSGLWILSNRKDLPVGPGCTANGLIGQLSVQATDCSILLIAIITLSNIKTTTFLQDSSTLVKTLTCMSAWILPIITSFVGLGFNVYTPVNGNWCWIIEEPKYWRYVLTHAWRLISIIGSTIIYTYIFFYIRKRFQNLRMLTWNSRYINSTEGLIEKPTLYPRKRDANLSVEDGTTFRPSVDTGGLYSKDNLSWASPTAEQQSLPESQNTYTPGKHLISDTSSLPALRPAPIIQGPRVKNLYGLNPSIDTQQRSPVEDQLLATEKRIRQTLLLNGYPIAYVVLWLPGIANRIAEAITGQDFIVLGYLQTTTQFVGLANALTYGLNENMIMQLKERLFGSEHAAQEQNIDSKLLSGRSVP